MKAAAQFLCRLGVLDGPVPQYGDWDEGGVLTSTGDPHDLAGTVRLALALAGSGAPEAWREAHDECAWYVGVGEPVQPDEAMTAGDDLGADIARASVGEMTVWLKMGFNSRSRHESPSERTCCS